MVTDLIFLIASAGIKWSYLVGYFSSYCVDRVPLDRMKLYTHISILSEVFKANKGMKHPAPLTHHSSRGKHKIFGASCIDACWFWKSDRGKDDHNSDPLGHSRVKKLVDSLQLDHLLFAEAEQGDVHEALGKSELAAQLSQTFCHLFKLLAECHLWIGLSLSAFVSITKVAHLLL